MYNVCCTSYVKGHWWSPYLPIINQVVLCIIKHLAFKNGSHLQIAFQSGQLKNTIHHKVLVAFCTSTHSIHTFDLAWNPYSPTQHVRLRYHWSVQGNRGEADFYRVTHCPYLFNSRLVRIPQADLGRPEEPGRRSGPRQSCHRKEDSGRAW